MSPQRTFSANPDVSSPSVAERLPVAVVGCGWLGLPLAQRLMELDFPVHGSTTRPSRLKTLRDMGIDAALLRLDPDLDESNLSQEGAEISSNSATNRLLASPQIVVNIPPSGVQTANEHISQLRSLIRRWLTSSAVASSTLVEHAQRHLIFISSTSVYGAISGEVTEATPPNPQGGNGAILLEAERFLEREAQASGFALTIIRSAGLVGFGRHPGRFLAGRTGVKDADHPVNMIHQLDLVECIAALLSAPIPPPKNVQLFNAVAQSHPSRREFYTTAALRLDLKPPEFSEPPNESTNEPAGEAPQTHGKRISGERLKKATGVKFKFDDLMAAFEEKRL